MLGHGDIVAVIEDQGAIVRDDPGRGWRKVTGGAVNAKLKGARGQESAARIGVVAIQDESIAGNLGEASGPGYRSIHLQRGAADVECSRAIEGHGPADDVHTAA